VAILLTTYSAQAGNYETCISGDYPTLCKHHLLTPEQAEKVKIAEESANFRTCISGDYPTLCKHHLLTPEQAAQVKAAELGDNLAVLKQVEEQETPDTDKPSSDLPNCPSDQTKRYHNCFGTYTFGPNSEWAGDKYVGEFVDDVENGSGTYTFANGDQYVGDFLDGTATGKGSHIYGPNSEWAGDKYVGDFKNWVKIGKGTYTFANGDQYVGEFKNDVQNGRGTYTYVNGEKYVGDFLDGTATGKGSHIYGPNSEWAGHKYVGDFKNWVKIGRGTYTFANGDQYVGEFKDNFPNGKGTYTFANGDRYVGEFRDGASNGHGAYTFSGGTVKEGIWKDWVFQYEQKLSPPAPIVKSRTQSDEIIFASSGSGFAVSADGYVITNNHVIEGCQKVVVHIKGTEIPVTVVTYDPQNDLALLKGNFRPSTVFPLTNKRPELLQDVYVAGFPFGNNVSTAVKVTKGIISSLTGIGNNFSNIQIDAALQSGNSGGPILDDLGNVVGVAVSKLDAKYMFDNFGSIPENTNFGIKSNVVRNIIEGSSVDSLPANRVAISKSHLGKMINDGTYYISCWMTMTQVEKLRTKKVMFEDLK